MGGHVSKISMGSKQASKQESKHILGRLRKKKTYFRNQGLVQVFKCISNILCSWWPHKLSSKYLDGGIHAWHACMHAYAPVLQCGQRRKRVKLIGSFRPSQCWMDPSLHALTRAREWVLKSPPAAAIPVTTKSSRSSTTTTAMHAHMSQTFWWNKGCAGVSCCCPKP